MINRTREILLPLYFEWCGTRWLRLRSCRQHRIGFTLVELLVSMCVSLMLLGGVVSLFGTLGESVNDSKSGAQSVQTMRHAAKQLQDDLGNISLVPDPTQNNVSPQGFFEYVEGVANDNVPYSEQQQEDPLPDPIILDDAGGSFTPLTGPKNNQWFRPFNNGTAKKQSYGNTVHERDSRYLSYAGEFKRSGLQNGKYRVSLTWPIDWKYNGGYETKTESNVPVTLSSGEDSQTSSVDQIQPPSGFADPDGAVNAVGNPIMWQDIGEVDVTNGEIIVLIGPCGTGYPSGKKAFADAIRIECLELTGGGSTGNEPTVAQLPLVGDCDDVLHFTTKTDEGAFEVVWFLTPMEGTPSNSDGSANADTRYRLHRKELKIDPSSDPDTAQSVSLGFEQPMPAGYAGDFEKWLENDAVRVPNTLAMLAMRYNRNSHVAKEPDSSRSSPLGEFEVNRREDYQETLEGEFTEITHDNKEIDRTYKTVILENVIGFDVKYYDPNAEVREGNDGVPLSPDDQGHSSGTVIGKGAFRDLDPAAADSLSQLSTQTGTATYDSWSGAYVNNVDFDFDGDGIPGTAADAQANHPPPYNWPLKAVQIEIRTQNPETGKVRSVKVRKFLGKR